MFFKLNPQVGQPLYLQLMQQIRHAVDTGILQRGPALRFGMGVKPHTSEAWGGSYEIILLP